jgi:C1A family cysteine protease
MKKQAKFKRAYGWKPDVPDFRDFKFKIAQEEQLPEKMDLTELMPPVYNQLTVGSCTAQAIAAALDYDRKQRQKEFMDPSRLFIYYNERDMEGTVGQDSGAYIRDGIKSVADLGVCHEALWPYDIARFKDRPDSKCYEEAVQYQALRYERLDNRSLYSLKYALAKGHPIVFGFAVYESFETREMANTGIGKMPGRKERMLGGHAVLAAAYDDSIGRFLIRNSWSSSWGMKGYFTLPYEYLTSTDLADDFWVITETE